MNPPFANIINSGVNIGTIFRMLLPLGVFIVTGFLLSNLFPLIRRKFEDLSDRIVLSVYFGMAFYSFLFMLFNGLFQFEISLINIYVVFLIVLLACGVYYLKKGIDLRGNFSRGQLLILLSLFVIFLLSVELRLTDTLKHPDLLLTTDPYRHHPRVRHIVETGDTARWDPLIMGKVPIFEMQGSYVLTAVIALISGFSPKDVVKFGSILMGCLAVISVYFLGKYAIKKSTLLGVTTAAVLAASPVHIVRTSIGFSQSWSLPYFALLLLFFLLFIQSRRLQFAAILGIFYTAMVMSNQVNGALLAPLLVLFTVGTAVACALKKDKESSRSIIRGSFVALSIFLIMIVVWAVNILGSSLVEGLFVSSREATDMIARKDANFLFELSRNIGHPVLWGSILGLVCLIAGFFPGSPLRLGLTDGQDKKGENRLKVTMFLPIFGREHIFVKIFLAAYIIFFFALILGTRYGLPTVIGAYYRYFLPLSYPLCFLASFFLILVADNVITPIRQGIEALIERQKDQTGEALCSVTFRWGRSIRRYSVAARKLTYLPYFGVYSGLIIFLFSFVANSRGWGRWGLTFTSSEYAACQWIKHNLPKNALIATNWFAADLVRSYTHNGTVLTNLRKNIDMVKSKDNLNIPVLKGLESILGFSKNEDGDLYVLKDKWGPYYTFKNNPNFELVFETGEKHDIARVFKVSKEGVITGNLALHGFPIGKSETGPIRNLNRINDGEMLNGKLEFTASSRGRAKKAEWAWFGLEFEKSKLISKIVAYTGCSNDKSKIAFIPDQYVLQYLSGKKWKDISKTRVRNNKKSEISHAFRPVFTKKIRLYVYSQWNDSGRKKGGFYRTCVRELKVY